MSRWPLVSSVVKSVQLPVYWFNCDFPSRLAACSWLLLILHTAWWAVLCLSCQLLKLVHFSWHWRSCDLIGRVWHFYIASACSYELTLRSASSSAGVSLMTIGCTFLFFSHFFTALTVCPYFCQYITNYFVFKQYWLQWCFFPAESGCLS